MTKQTNKNILNNIKTVHDIHTSGDIISFLRNVRETLSNANSFCNKLNEKVTAKKEEKVVVKPVEKDVVVEKKLPKVDEEAIQKQKLEDKKLFQEQVKNMTTKRTNNRPDFSQNKPELNNKNTNNRQPRNSFEQKRTFNSNNQNNFNRPNGQNQSTNTNQNYQRNNRNFSQSTNNNFRNNQNNNGQNGYRSNFNQNNNQNGFRNNYNQNNGNNPNGFRNNYNQNNNGQNGYRNNFNQNNQNGFRNNFNQNNQNNFRTNNFQKNGFNKQPYNSQNSNFSKQRTGTSTFASTKANGFRNFNAPAPTERLIVQQERNYGNKNKSGFKNFDDKKQGNKRFLQRRGYIELDENNEEVMSFRKLAKPKKKSEVFVAPTVTNAVMTTESITVKVLSEKIGKPVPEIIKKLMQLGIMATINSAIDFNTADLVSGELGVKLEQKIEQSYEEKLLETSKEEIDKDAIKRPPVVTVMGHVDHGKTSLLDAIRKTSIAKGEAGGITQKIGAYTITTNNEKITFIDTPGHSAFTSMRARGAKVTDIAILVVAGDDGIMPQTIEAISHIKAANVPIIVAVNKMDLPDSNIERVKAGLAENGVLPEDWGGNAIIVPISAKTGVGIDTLIESILLVAEMQELKANPNKMATGTVIEAELDKNRGPIATVLVQSGTLHIGDSIMSGLTFGKVKAMFNENGKQVKVATPSMPVSVLGLYAVPNSGDQVFAVDEKLSKNVISERKNKLKEEADKKTSGVSLDDFMDRVNEGKLKSLNIIIKGDTQGSVEALKQTLTAIKNEEVKVNCIHSAVGNVSESDIVLAQASNAIIINFNIKVLPKIQLQADNLKVEIKQYNVIYAVVEDITDAINGMLTVKYEQVVTGHAEVRAVFKLSTNGLIAGSYVTDGKIIRSGSARLIRDGEVIADTDIVALKIVKDDKSEIATGFECGIKLKEVSNLKEGDIIECYENVPIKRV